MSLSETILCRHALLVEREKGMFTLGFTMKSFVNLFLSPLMILHYKHISLITMLKGVSTYQKSRFAIVDFWLLQYLDALIYLLQCIESLMCDRRSAWCHWCVITDVPCYGERSSILNTVGPVIYQTYDRWCTNIPCCWTSDMQSLILNLPYSFFPKAWILETLEDHIFWSRSPFVDFHI